MPIRTLGRELAGSAAFGLAVIVFFVVGGVAWAMLAPLTGAVIAEGRIAFESERKTIQHLEGGIIKDIFVDEGNRVEAGALLLALEDTGTRVRAEELRGRIRALAGEEARLRAERSRRPAILFDHPFLTDRNDSEVAAILEQQESLFAARARNLKTQEGILHKRTDQLGRQSEGLRKQLTGVRKRLRLIREEEAAVAELVSKGYAPRPRLLAIRRAEAELVATEGELLSSIARVEVAVNEINLQIARIETELLEEVDDKLAEVSVERVSAEQLHSEMLDRLERTQMVAPVAGVVLNVRFKTIGGVIQPGAPILDLAPVQDELIIDTRLRPTDVDEVVVGSAATVDFSAYPQRYLKRVRGQVVRVSADAFEDPKSAESYYTAIVEIDRAHLSTIAPDIKLAAGMPAEVYIVTAERTLFEFLVEPIRRVFARALRES